MIGQAFLSSIGGLLIDSVNINNILLRFHELACRTAVIFLRFQALALGLPQFACKRKEKKKHLQFCRLRYHRTYSFLP